MVGYSLVQGGVSVSRTIAAAAAGVVIALGGLWVRGAAIERPQVREVVVIGDDFAFSPARIEVQKDDLVQIRFTAKDIAHSFTIDAPYRISKRASSGNSIVFEFRADEAGRFTYYCNLTQDDRCKKMKGELVVR
jgi:heme/copper-type cytochrome/quinol oxidase subunit 2